MQLPQLNVIKKSTSVIEEFLGYNAQTRISEQEFRDDLNMSSCEYPVLRPRALRNKRLLFETTERVDGSKEDDNVYGYDQMVLCSADKIAYLVGPNLFYGEALVAENFATGENDRLIFMNDKLITFPAGRVYDIENDEVNDIGVIQDINNPDAYNFDYDVSFTNFPQRFTAFKSGKEKIVDIEIGKEEFDNPDKLFDALDTGTTNVKFRVEEFKSSYFECKSVSFKEYNTSSKMLKLELVLVTKKKNSSTRNLLLSAKLTAYGNTALSRNTYVTATLCNGTDYDDISNVTSSATAPSNPENGDYWIDTSKREYVMKEWDSNSSQWVQVLTAYYRFDIINGSLDSRFREGDTVQLDTGDDEVDGQWDLYAVNSEYFVINAVLRRDSYTFSNKCIISRNCPDLDYICECDNRIWGVDSAANEIHACALGDPYNWEQDSQALSTDSYSLKVGSEGAFTGIATWNGYVLCFKENYIHKIYGTKPTNYSMKTVKCDGVQEGAHDSLATVDGVLYYKGVHGIFAYAGNLPELVSKFGNAKYSGGHGGAFEKKYYIRFDNAAFSYDTQYGIWHKESFDNVKSNFIEHYCDMYFMTKKAVSDEYSESKYSTVSSCDIGNAIVGNASENYGPCAYMDIDSSGYTTGKTYYIVSHVEVANLLDASGIPIVFTEEPVTDGLIRYRFSLSSASNRLRLCLSKMNYYRCVLEPGTTIGSTFIAGGSLRGTKMTQFEDTKRYFWFVSDDPEKFVRDREQFNGDGEELVVDGQCRIIDGDMVADETLIYLEPITGGYRYWRFKDRVFETISRTNFAYKIKSGNIIKIQEYGPVPMVDSDVYLNRSEEFEENNVPEAALSWKADTGEIGLSLPGKKWVSRILIRASIGEGASLKVYTEYDSDGIWKCNYDRTGQKSLNTIVMPIIPCRCDHMRIRFEGTGLVRIYSVTKEIETGSEM